MAPSCLFANVFVMSACLLKYMIRLLGFSQTRAQGLDDERVPKARRQVHKEILLVCNDFWNRLFLMRI